MLKNFLKGLLFGSSLGTLLGLLFAPDSGENMRKKLQAGLDEAQISTDNLDQSLQNFKHSLATLKETCASLIGPLSKETKKTLNDFKFQVEPRIIQIKEQLETIQQDVQKPVAKKFVRYYLPQHPQQTRPMRHK